MRDRLLAWWRELNERERVALALGAVAVAVLAGYGQIGRAHV